MENKEKNKQEEKEEFKTVADFLYNFAAIVSVSGAFIAWVAASASIMVKINAVSIVTFLIATALILLLSYATYKILIIPAELVYNVARTAHYTEKTYKLLEKQYEEKE